jgi:ribose/xylose/arabinose/galactoside ABC-type transport system permease subunit
VYRKNEILRKAYSIRELPILLFVIALMLIFSLMIKNFVTVKNFEAMSRQISVIGIMAAGMTFCILTGGIDLSVGSMMAFSTCMGGMLISKGTPWPFIYIVILVSGLILGFINGRLIAWLKVPALIVTLGSMSIFRGLIMIVTKGRYITPIPRVYEFIGSRYYPFVCLVVVTVIFIWITRMTRFGRNLYAIGGNEAASLYSGVPVSRYKILVYSISGLLSAVAGIVFIGQSGFIQPQAGVNYEMNTIAAVVIGGTSIAGGSGSVLGSFLGSILMGLILSGLTMLSVNPYWQGLVTGILIIIAIMADAINTKRKAKR